MTQLARAAVAYARMGIAVFPLKPRDKKPYPFTTGLLAASSSPDLAAMRWAGQVELPLREKRTPDERLPRQVRAGPLANIGIETGAASGFWVLDTDGEEAEAALAALEAVHGALPTTVQQMTGNGVHRLFAWDPARPIRNSAGKIGPHIDVRGDGGYIVAPPSIHPSGRQYAWAWGRSPQEIAFAAAPDWLVKLAMPAEAPTAVAVAAPRLGQDGQATRFGEAVLATACRTILTAPLGKRQSTLWGYACQIGGFVGGDEIRQAYAAEQLTAAGLGMQSGLCDKPEAIRRHVERGIAAGMRFPRTAPERRPFSPAVRRPAPAAARPSAAAQAVNIRDARELWASGRDADCGLVRSWFKVRGLEPHAIAGALSRLRAVQRAPLHGEATGPALLLPLQADLAGRDPPDGVAVLPLLHERIVRFLGEAGGRVIVLAPPAEDGALLVALDVQDAWALGANAHENGHELGVIVAPTLRTFAGGPLGDRFGRVDPQTPHADPEDPPWTLSGDRGVFLAVRGDLRTPELRTRKTFGGTATTRLEGEAAARFYAGLAEQAWRKAGANRVRIMRPMAGTAGFNQRSGVTA